MARRLAPRPIANQTNSAEAELSPQGASGEAHFQTRRKGNHRVADESEGLTKTEAQKRKQLYGIAPDVMLYGWEPQSDDPTTQLCGYPVTPAQGSVCRNSAGSGTLHQGIGYCASHQITAAREHGVYLADLYRGQSTDPEDALERQLAQSQSAIAVLTALVAEMPLRDLEATPEGRVAMRLLGQERDRLMRTAKSMIDMDFRERQTGLAEKLSQPIVAVLEGVLADLRLDRAQQAAVGPIVRKHLALLEGGRLPVAEAPITVDAEDAEIVDEEGQDHASG